MFYEWKNKTSEPTLLLFKTETWKLVFHISRAARAYIVKSYRDVKFSVFV